MLAISLLLSVAQMLAQVFLNVKTIESEAIQYLVIVHMVPDVLYAMVLINPSIIGRCHDATKRTRC